MNQRQAVTNVIQFAPLPPDPLTPYLGKWILDDISVSRNKSSKAHLGEEGLKKLWACDSMAEMRTCLESDPALNAKYQGMLARRIGETGYMLIARETITNYRQGYINNIPPKTVVYPVMNITTEGRKVIVKYFDRERDRPFGKELRMKKQWLLASERYYGGNALIFPRSPVHRYYRAE